MAVRASTAADLVPSGHVPGHGAEHGAEHDPGAQRPIRTCIGCRRRSPAAELLRIVVAPGTVLVVPDPRHRAPGRGAWLHRDPGCVELAERRRAYARALRVPGPVDPAPVREYVTGSTANPPGGTPQELKSNGLPMKRQQ